MNNSRKGHFSVSRMHVKLLLFFEYEHQEQGEIAKFSYLITVETKLVNQISDMTKMEMEMEMKMKMCYRAWIRARNNKTP